MSTMMTLDVDAVHAFVLIADLQSFTRAAEALDTSQAAISVKLKRLETRLGERLIERTPRLVRPSARGAAFLGVAREFLAAHERAVAGLSTTSRRFTLGIADQVAGPELPVLLARLHAYDPALLIEVQIEASRNLLDAFERGALDAAIIRREDDRRDGAVLSRERFGWFAAPGFEHRDGDALRLASLAASCGVRNIATRALDTAGVNWVEVFFGWRHGGSRCRSLCRTGRRGAGAPRRPARRCRGQRKAWLASASFDRNRLAYGLVGSAVPGSVADNCGGIP